MLTADMLRGWRRERRSPDAPPMKTFCFSGVVDADRQGGTIHAQLSLFPRPGGLTEEWVAPPDLILPGMRGRRPIVTVRPDTGERDVEFVDDCCVTRASDGILVASVDLLNNSGETPRLLDLRPNRAGHLMFERLNDCPVYNVKGEQRFILDIQLRLTFKPPQRPAPVERSFWSDFLPGGRPESNRRKF
jgi:hypothetical protein